MHWFLKCAEKRYEIYISRPTVHDENRTLFLNLSVGAKDLNIDQYMFETSQRG